MILGRFSSDPDMAVNFILADGAICLTGIPQSEIDVFNTYSKILNPFKGMRGAIKVCQQDLFEAVLCLFCDLL